MKTLRSTLLFTLVSFAAISGANAATVSVVNESLKSGDGEFYFVELQTYNDGAQPLTKYQIVVPRDAGSSNSQGHGTMPKNLGNVRLYKAPGSPDDMSAFERGQRIYACREAEEGSVPLKDDTGIMVTVKQIGDKIVCYYSD